MKISDYDVQLEKKLVIANVAGNDNDFIINTNKFSNFNTLIRIFGYVLPLEAAPN